MNAPKSSLAPSTNPLPSPPSGSREPEAKDRDSLDSGWFVDPPSSIRPVARARAKSVPPTGDDDVDAWLR